MRYVAAVLAAVLLIGSRAAKAEEAMLQPAFGAGDSASLIFVRHGCGAGKHRVNGRCVTDPGRVGFRFSTRTGLGPKCRYEYRFGEKVRVCR